MPCEKQTVYPLQCCFSGNEASLYLPQAVSYVRKGEHEKRNILEKILVQIFKSPPPPSSHPEGLQGIILVEKSSVSEGENREV